MMCPNLGMGCASRGHFQNMDLFWLSPYFTDKYSHQVLAARRATALKSRLHGSFLFGDPYDGPRGVVLGRLDPLQLVYP